jgi:hypothetical protein
MTEDDVRVEALNRECFCIGTDLDALHAWLERDLAAHGLARPIVESHPHLFSALPVFVSRTQIERMQAIVAAVETVVASPAYRAAALADAPPIAHRAPGNPGVLTSYDFHLAAPGPQLIEINTNAGGALLCAALARAQRACCPEVESLLSNASGDAPLDAALLADFREDWRLARGARPLERIAIVDRAPAEQYLYPEFLLFQRLFEENGIEALVADPGELGLDRSGVHCAGRRIDLVYDRLTDFYLEEDANAVLRRAYAQDAVVLTPHPHAHALYANKRNLVRLTDRALLAGWSIDADVAETLLGGVPQTCIVDRDSAQTFWETRKDWFFKPARGFGSRGSYRGDKITRKAFAAVVDGDYVAQRLVPPSERSPADAGVLKVDIRAYVYRGRLRLIAARLYQGQTTNFRTPGGGFAPVFYPREDGAESCSAPCAPEAS